MYTSDQTNERFFYISFFARKAPGLQKKFLPEASIKEINRKIAGLQSSYSEKIVHDSESSQW